MKPCRTPQLHCFSNAESDCMKTSYSYLDLNIRVQELCESRLGGGGGEGANLAHHFLRICWATSLPCLDGQSSSALNGMFLKFWLSVLSLLWRRRRRKSLLTIIFLKFLTQTNESLNFIILNAKHWRKNTKKQTKTIYLKKQNKIKNKKQMRITLPYHTERWPWSTAYMSANSNSVFPYLLARESTAEIFL